MSAGSFNLYFNLSKCLTQDAKDLLKARTSDADHEFCTTDAMKTVIHVTKNIFKNKPTLANQYQIYSIDCMYISILHFLWGEEIVKRYIQHPLILHSYAC